MFGLLGSLLQQTVQVLSSGVRVVGCFQLAWLCVLSNTRSNYSSLSRKRRVAMPPNYAFKPTAGEVIRFNQPLWAGGGLTRR